MGRTPQQAIEAAVAYAGSENKLAKLARCSQPAINRARKRGSWSPDLSARIHHGTHGAIPAWELSPGTWRKGMVPPLPEDWAPSLVPSDKQRSRSKRARVAS